MFVFRGNSGDSPNRRVCSQVQNPQALVWKWRQNPTFNINIPTVIAPASTKKEFIFKLTIEDYFINHSDSLGSKLLPLAQIKSVASFLGHPVDKFNFTKILWLQND